MGKLGQIPPPGDNRHERIRQLAYRYWLERGCVPGMHEVDWLRAERHIDEAVPVKPDTVLVSASKMIGSILGNVRGILLFIAGRLKKLAM